MKKHKGKKQREGMLNQREDKKIKKHKPKIGFIIKVTKDNYHRRSQKQHSSRKNCKDLTKRI